MKVYVTARFKGAENRREIEELCTAVKLAGLEDYCFVRDAENYQNTFNDSVELWKRTKEEIKTCDALLIDVSNAPTGGRVIEAGIAYGLGLPVLVAVKAGVSYKDLYNGIAALIITYSSPTDIAYALSHYLTPL